MASLSRDTFKETFHHYSKEALEQHLAEHYNEQVWQKDIAAPAVRIYVAEAKGQLIAYMKLGPYKLPLSVPESPVSELHRLYVRRDYHGQGVGNAMIEKALEDFQAANMKAALLGVYENNLRAQRFYTRYGFAVVGEYTYPPIGAQVDRELIMKKVFA